MIDFYIIKFNHTCGRGNIKRNFRPNVKMVHGGTNGNFFIIVERRSMVTGQCLRFTKQCKEDSLR